MWHVSSLAGFIVRAAAGAMAVSLLGAGQALASPMSPDASVGPVSTAQSAFTGDGSRIGIRLTRVRWTSDTRVSGTVRWNQVSGRVWARLTIAGPGGNSASVRLWYFDYVRHSAARLSGRYQGQRIEATMPAP
jgi:hypothetical protein